MADIQQRSFVGGMDLLSLDTEIDNTAYRVAFNIRQREGFAQAINKSVNITFNLRGKFQGLYAVGAIWLAFYSGNAYFMPVGGNTWIQVPFLSLDPFVEYIYAQTVTGSTNNFLRQAIITQGVVDGNAGVIKNNAFSVSGTPAGVVCQDGLNQPWLITYDSVNQNATARRLKTYDLWINDDSFANAREYVPIGTKMMYLDGVLYVVKGNIVYRSVSGRPLDFMINIDKDGNKLPTEALGGAQTTSFAQDFDDINALLPIGTGQFLIATARFIYGEQTDTTNTIFGEPTFGKSFQIEAGAVNQFCFSDKNGDAVFTDFEGITFFNSVQQLKFEGKNNPLSKNINTALKGITQRVCCSVAFDNYNLCAVNTIYGYAIAVYDNMLNVWVGFDTTSATVSGIKMFAEAVVPNVRYLGAGNQNGEIWLMYANTSDNECGIMQLRSFVSGSYSNLGNFIPDGLFVEHKTNHFKVGTYCGARAGNITTIEYVDNKMGQIAVKPLDGVIQGVRYPVGAPVLPASNRSINSVLFPFNVGMTGYKISPIIRWSSDAKIVKAELSSSPSAKPMSQQQQAKVLTHT